MCSSDLASVDPELQVDVGDQVLVAGQKQGTVRFYGKTDFAPGLIVYLLVYLFTCLFSCL